MKPHDLRPAEGAVTKPTRVGRGDASRRGKTAGRGTKGTKARGKVRQSFEGGQMPLFRRVPKLKGFRPVTRTVYGVVNLSELAELAGKEIGPEEMRSAGLLKKRDKLVKVLGVGEVAQAVTVRAHAFSGSARQKIEAAGGKAEIIGQQQGDKQSK